MGKKPEFDDPPALPLPDEQALAHLVACHETQERLTELKAWWGVHVGSMFGDVKGEPLAEADALALLTEIHATREQVATQKAVWNLHVESLSRQSRDHIDALVDPAVAAYYEAAAAKRRPAQQKSSRKVRERQAWELLRQKVQAAAAKHAPVSQSISNHVPRSAQMSKEDAANNDDAASTTPEPSWASAPTNKKELAYADQAKFAQAKADALADPKRAKQSEAGRFALAEARKDARSQKKEKAAGKPAEAVAKPPPGAVQSDDLKRAQTVMGTAHSLMSAPINDLTPQVAAGLVTSDIALLKEITTEPPRILALKAIAASSHAQQAYRAELEKQVPGILDGLEASEGARNDPKPLEPASGVKIPYNPTLDTVAHPTPQPALSQEEIQSADVKRAHAVIGTAHILMSAPVNDLTPQLAAEMVADDVRLHNAISTGWARHLALNAMGESGRAQPRYQDELAKQAPELVAKLAAADKAAEERAWDEAIDEDAQRTTPENAIERGPVLVAQPERQQAPAAAVQGIDPAAMEAVAAARARDWQRVARMPAMNTIERGDPLEAQPAAPAPASAAAVPPPLSLVKTDPALTAVPDEVERAYLHVGNKFHMPKNKERVAFEDHGAKLKTALNMEPVTLAMVQIAHARGWSSIKVSGAPEFCQQAWRDASLLGIAVQGYKPTDLDRADLARRMAMQPANNQVGMAQPARQGTGVYVSAEDAALLAAVKAAGWGAPATSAPSPAAAAPAARAPAPAAGTPSRADILVAHGPAKYEHKPENPESYFVTLENAKGVQRTVWGVKLGEAIARANVKPGDRIKLEKNGQELVEVDANVTDQSGKVVGSKRIGAHRNEWSVKVEAFVTQPPAQAMAQHQDLAGAFAVQGLIDKQAAADGFTPAAREIIAARTQQNAAQAVGRGELPQALRKEKPAVNQQPQQQEIAQ